MDAVTVEQLEEIKAALTLTVAVGSSTEGPADRGYRLDPALDVLVAEKRDLAATRQFFIRAPRDDLTVGRE